MYKNLLVATDGSKLSEKAVAHAVGLAHAVGATITAFYAAPDYPMPAYADGVVYTAAGSFLLALDAKTGKPIPTFGTNGQANVILDVLKDRYPQVTTPISMGYWFTSAPQVLAHPPWPRLSDHLPLAAEIRL
jgi:nucleotide-binding universal stress UspA family protein